MVRILTLARVLDIKTIGVKQIRSILEKEDILVLALPISTIIIEKVARIYSLPMRVGGTGVIATIFTVFSLVSKGWDRDAPHVGGPVLCWRVFIGC